MNCPHCQKPTSDGVHTCSPQYPGTQWIPSNGAAGYSFIESTCSTCTRDKAMREGADIDECDDNERCDIIAASFRGEAVQWRRLEDGQVICTAYIEHGKPAPPERCPNTVDLFGGEQA